MPEQPCVETEGPGFALLDANPGPVIYNDAGAIGNTAANYIYVVRGSGAGVTRSGNRTREYGVPLTRGS